MEMELELNIKTTENEKAVIEKLTQKNSWIDCSFTRRSGREYDIEVEGKYPIGDKYYLFAAYLPLAIIQASNWTKKKIWRYSDGYGEPGYVPSQGYDWSGIRDSSEVAIMKMMNIALKEIMK